MLLRSQVANLLGNILTGKEVTLSEINGRGIITAGEGTIRADENTIRAGQGTVRAGNDF